MRVVLETNIGWMAWNGFLAVVPALLAVALFRTQRRPSPLWWAELVVFVAFLPNAPYVLTDVVHLRWQIRLATGEHHVAALLFQYGLLWSVGFAAYVWSVVRAERWLRSLGVSRVTVVVTDLAVHGLCAVGVVLGRIVRLNSWDLVTRPQAVMDAFGWPSAKATWGVAVVFVVLAGGTLAVRAIAGSLPTGIRAAPPSPG